MIVADVLKYLACEIGTPTINLVVGMEVMNFRVCEEEERAAPIDDEGSTYILFVCHQIVANNWSLMVGDNSSLHDVKM